MIFDKPTLRTQASFAAGIAELGGHPMLVDGQPRRHRQAGVRCADVARVLGRQASAIVWRTYEQSRIDEMAAYAGVPVVNALTDEFHPCQLLADLLTVQEHKGRLAGLGWRSSAMRPATWATRGPWPAAIAGTRRSCSDARDCRPQRCARPSTYGEGQVTSTTTRSRRSTGADVVVTDTWVSMGKEEEAEARRAIFAPYAVTSELMAHAKPDAIVLHCLPAYRGSEIAAEVLDGPQSVVWDEAENRKHAQKAILAWLDARRHD